MIFCLVTKVSGKTKVQFARVWPILFKNEDVDQSTGQRNIVNWSFTKTKGTTGRVVEKVIIHTSSTHMTSCRNKDFCKNRNSMFFIWICSAYIDILANYFYLSHLFPLSSNIRCVGKIIYLFFSIEVIEYQRKGKCESAMKRESEYLCSRTSHLFCR